MPARLLHAPPPLADRPAHQLDLALLRLLFPSTPPVRNNVTCKEEKKRKQSLGSSLSFQICSLLVSLFLSVHCSLLVAGPAVASRSEMRPLLWAPLEEDGLMLAGEGSRGSEETGNGPARSLIGGDEAVC